MEALHGLRLVATGGLVSARLVAAFFARLGADVVRVVPVDPPGRRPAGQPAAGVVRVLPLDLFDPRGIDLIRRLLRRSDILVDGHGADVMSGLGLGTTLLRADNRGLVIVRMAAFEPAPVPSDRHRVRGSRTGTEAATAAVMATLVALHARSRSGEGQDVDQPILVPLADIDQGAPSPGIHRELLGLSLEELRELARDGVI
jgi:crotonobetainyl-CoA:carnitine CoA-transferase CaiB-like acyl-CoA transferase